MQRSYAGAVCEGNGTYGIMFPDFPGCISAGDTLDKVLANGHEALQFHIEAMVMDGDPIPDPRAWTITDVDAVYADPDDPVEDESWAGVFAIDVDIPDYPEKIALEVDGAVVREIAKLAQQQHIGINARRIVEDAARRELARLKQSA